MSTAPYISYDFVYMSHNTNEFLNVHIGLSVENNHLDLVIEADHLPDIQDLDGILKTVRRDNLQKLRLEIWDDFHLILKAEGINYDVLLDPETDDVVGIEAIK